MLAAALPKATATATGATADAAAADYPRLAAATAAMASTTLAATTAATATHVSRVDSGEVRRELKRKGGLNVWLGMRLVVTSSLMLGFLW